jgi:hypothetical protein
MLLSLAAIRKEERACLKPTSLGAAPNIPLKAHRRWKCFFSPFIFTAIAIPLPLLVLLGISPDHSGATARSHYRCIDQVV